MQIIKLIARSSDTLILRMTAELIAPRIFLVEDQELVRNLAKINHIPKGFNAAIKAHPKRAAGQSIAAPEIVTADSPYSFEDRLIDLQGQGRLQTGDNVFIFDGDLSYGSDKSSGNKNRTKDFNGCIDVLKDWQGQLDDFLVALFSAKSSPDGVPDKFSPTECVKFDNTWQYQTSFGQLERAARKDLLEKGELNTPEIDPIKYPLNSTDIRKIIKLDKRAGQTDAFNFAKLFLHFFQLRDAKKTVEA